MKKILVLHGPNLNLLGEREPEIYGTTTLDELNDILEDLASEKKYSVIFYQSNHEGKLIDYLHENRKNADGVLINPGGLTHTSICLRDAISSVRLPAVEIHMTEIYQREDFRRISVIKGVCINQFIGEGVESYKKGLNFLMNYLSKR